MIRIYINNKLLYNRHSLIKNMKTVSSGFESSIVYHDSYSYREKKMLGENERKEIDCNKI